MNLFGNGDAVLAQILDGGLEKGAASRKLKQLRAQEMQMWQDWKASDEDPEKLKPLLTSFQPVVKKQVNVYKGVVPIPQSALEAEFKNHLVTALRTYDPNRGAQLGTHVHNQMKRGKRFVVRYQNVGAIPEMRAYKITEFNTARSELGDKLGRDPTSLELSDKLKWNPREVDRMTAELRPDIPTSSFRGPEGEQWDPTVVMPSREMEVVRLMPAALKPEERAVFEYTFGLSGKPQLRPGQIATQLNMSPSKVARIRGKLATKVKDHYGGLDDH